MGLFPIILTIFRYLYQASLKQDFFWEAILLLLLYENVVLIPSFSPQNTIDCHECYGRTHLIEIPHGNPNLIDRIFSKHQQFDCIFNALIAC